MRSRWLDIFALVALPAACSATDGDVADLAASEDAGQGGGYVADSAVWSDGGSGEDPADSGGPDSAIDVTCNDILEGTSTVVVNGETREFSVRLPSDTSSMALLFLWHGWRQPPMEFANTIVYDVPTGRWVPFDPNAFPMPLMIVTPFDTHLLPPVGLDWDISNGATDIPFFEGVLECIRGQFTIDATRIYSFGFSAGAVFSNLLTAHYPRLFAATISESGAWFNDRAEWSDVLVGGAGGLFPIVQWDWPAFDPADGGNVLLTHGGPGDFASVISLESANRKALTFLHDNGRTVTECAHTFGHTLDPDLTQSMYYQYLWAHQLGGPPLAAMVPGFPTEEAPVGATTCRLHP
ncbi:MAG: hypothetical protein HYY06_18575 [Deltaproteobacteria bacterium]|nr:hypothetical protein [Deltaproteobacteria bacterium]